MDKTTITLQPTKQALLAAATRIYAAYVASGQVADGQEDGWRARSVREAVWIAQQVDEAVLAEDEIRS
jgi:hypothetical protein